MLLFQMNLMTAKKGKGKIVPERIWIEDIINECRNNGTPVFMKDSLAEIWGKPLIQEYPW